ncbi:MAG: dolichol-phosphate mannosyltransferase [Pirellulaceae bacterium]|nr:MAG: dolichol-phosphate mannosyltransferase [Pirellulaceae bacterium]
MSQSGEPAALSIVIPVMDERDNLRPLYEELASVLGQHGYRGEIIFVDDGSTDGSWEVLSRLAAEDPRITAIRFRRNFGKAAALTAGVQASRGNIVITMDADLQDDPAEIPRMLQALASGLDVVSGWKRVRRDPWHKVWPSRVFNLLVGWLTGVKLHDHNCGFKCYRREVFEEVRIYGELHRFVPVLAAARGWNVGEVEVHHRPRRHGRSKYGVERFVKGWLDLMTVYFLTGFNQRPQHFLGTVGLLAFFTGLAGMAYLTVYWFLAQLYPDWGLLPLHQRPLLIYSVGLLLLGAQLVSIGFLAELMTAYYARDATLYSVKEMILARAPINRSADAATDAGSQPSDSALPRDDC